jgi:penicillin-binding protein 2
MKNQRPYFVYGFVVLVAIIYVIRLFNLQVLDKKYKLEAQRNTRKKIEIDAYRGRIVDRNGKLLVHNSPIFDLNVVMNDVEIEDTAQFCKILQMTRQDFDQRMAEIKADDKHYSRYKPYPFISRISAQQYALVQDVFNYKGFDFHPTIERKYPHTSFSLGLGYIAKISAGELRRDKESGDAYYRGVDYLGKTGIEKTYEKLLRGQRGTEYILVNVKGVKQGSYADGDGDTIAQAGMNLQSTIDLDLQAYGELLMKNKLGSLVAIEPSTGEILALVSGPSYDPNVLSGPDYSKNYQKLFNDENKPLFNRTIQSQYPPGSIFKIAQSLVLMQNKIIGPYQKVSISVRPDIMGDHAPSGMYDITRAIQLSSNTFYRILMGRMIEQKTNKSQFIDARYGLKLWTENMNQLGLGVRLGIDLPSEAKGLIPSVSFYDNIVGENRWKYSNFRSVSIGQGEVQMTPLQMANLAALIANRGYYIRPHVIRTGNDTLTPINSGIDSIYFEPVIEGMQLVVDAGTARRAYTKDIVICGKTGTVENNKGKDHSVFIAFAPRENPKIALACIVENSGNYGGTWAAPIVSLMIEQYLKGKLSDYTKRYKEPRILEADFITDEK